LIAPLEDVMKKSGVSLLVAAIAMVSLLIFIWSIAALLAGLHHANWQLSEFLRQYMVAVGMIQTFDTMVDFYSHIKGVEYLICLVFFAVFPLFYRYLNEEKKRIKTK
jgi:hypothetical protein